MKACPGRTGDRCRLEFITEIYMMYRIAEIPGDRFIAVVGVRMVFVVGLWCVFYWFSESEYLKRRIIPLIQCQ